jgi:hypothetical protein
MSIPRLVVATLLGVFAADMWLTWSYIDYSSPATPPARRRVVTVSLTRSKR